MFTVRPFSRPARPEHAFRIHLSVAALLSLKLRAGDLCQLRSDDGDTRYAIAWSSPEKIQDTIVQTSKNLQDLYGFKLGDKISISRTDEVLQPASLVKLCDITENNPALSEEEAPHWQFVCEIIIHLQHEALLVGQNISVEVVPGVRRDFRVLAVDTVSNHPIVKVSQDTKILISRPRKDVRTLKIPPGLVGGLSEQIEQIQKMMWLIAGRATYALPPSYRTSPGIILYGAKGTGKTLLIEQVALSGWNRIIRWKCDTKHPTISSSDQPCLVIVEGVDQSSDGGSSTSTTSSIRALFSSISSLEVLVLAETVHPNNINGSLRAVGLFAKEIELPIPSARDRAEILRARRGGNDQPDDEWIQEAASKTHGYVGGDLVYFFEIATQIALYRRGALQGHQEPEKVLLPSPPGPLYILSDLREALSRVGPSALQEVFLETPNVKWSDIGGQHEIKRKLKQAVEWPLKQAERMKALNLRPKKGILLYGPPGCSKTLLVKALATEAELNFLAVKGAELISMYVGESERAVREVFRKARAASPSIVFFDEIDSIASRGKTELNVLTTLLNEMDGFEELRGVFVVAATNKPQIIDPALMRPGRLDNLVYVGPPDVETRKEILQSWCSRSKTGANVEELAAQMEGFSGAEIIGICQTAGEYAMSSDRDDITSEDFARAIKETPKGITKAMLTDFEMWNASRT